MSKKTIHQWMRLWHRNVGYFAAGLIIIYALSGITLIYRDTDFLKTGREVHQTLAAQLKADDVGKALRLKKMKVVGEDEKVIRFQDGTYNKLTGEASYVVKELIFPFKQFVSFHKRASGNSFHWFNLALGSTLLFLVISSFWMFKPNSKQFKKGAILVVGGVALALLLIFI